MTPTQGAETTGRDWSETARLVTLAQDGDREAFGLLVEQFHRTVHAICLARLGHASEALELTQDVFLHAMNHLVQLREPERFAGWLKQMTHRMAINRATRRVPPTPIDDEILAGIGGPACDPLSELILREQVARLRAALDQLKPIDREALQAFYIQEMSLAEIAERFDLPLGTVKRRLHTARHRLRAVLVEDSHEPDDWGGEPADEQQAVYADLAVA